MSVRKLADVTYVANLKEALEFAGGKTVIHYQPATHLLRERVRFADGSQIILKDGGDLRNSVFIIKSFQLGKEIEDE